MGKKNGKNSEFIRQVNQIAQPCLASPGSHLALPEQCWAREQDRRTWVIVTPCPGGAVMLRNPYWLSHSSAFKRDPQTLPFHHVS